MAMCVWPVVVDSPRGGVRFACCVVAWLCGPAPHPRFLTHVAGAAQTGATTRTINAHKGTINYMAFNMERFMMLTCSADHHAKLWDVDTFEVKKDYRCDRPLNSGAISPLKEHVRGPPAPHISRRASQRHASALCFPWDRLVLRAPLCYVQCSCAEELSHPRALQLC